MFVEVDVEPGAATADGVSLRFKQIDELREIREVDYEAVDGVAGRFTVVACHDDDGSVTGPARAAHVEDSSDGVVWLVVGGAHGLLLRHESGATAREPYLVLSRTTHIS
jgi:hypothetical protein